MFLDVFFKRKVYSDPTILPELGNGPTWPNAPDRLGKRDGYPASARYHVTFSMRGRIDYKLGRLLREIAPPCGGVSPPHDLKKSPYHIPSPPSTLPLLDERGYENIMDAS